MKRKLLFLATLVVSALGMRAQTDVTNLLVNPSFEYSSAGVKYTAEAALSNGASIYGWTLPSLGDDYYNIQVTPKSSASTGNNTFGQALPSEGDFYFYNRKGWSTVTSSLTQTVTLDPGKYYITVDYKAAEWKGYRTKLGFKIADQEIVNTYCAARFEATATYFADIAWKTLGAWFTVETAGDVKIEIIETLGGNDRRADICLDNVKLYKWALDDQTNYDNATKSNPMDVTAKFVTNPYFDDNINDWTSTTGASSNKRATNKNDAVSGGFWENWNGSAKTSGKMSRTLTGLPDGIYRFTATAFGDQGTPALKLFAGSNSVDITSGTPSNYSVQTNVSGGSMEIGIKVESTNAAKWIGLDNVKLEYLGIDVDAAQAEWQNVHDGLAALDATALPDAAEAAIMAELAKACPSTYKEIGTATAALQALIDSYDGIKAAYDSYKALKAKVEDLKNTTKYTFSGDAAVSTLTNTLSNIDTDAEAATDAATLTNLLPNLKTAGNTFVGAIESLNGFDLTYNIENNSFETGALSPWTTNGSNDTGVKPNSNGTYTTTGVDGAYLFNTWNNGAGSKVSQALSNLPKGYYTVTALVASDAGNTINILAGATTKGIASDATGKTQFVEGTTDKTLVSDGSIEIGTNSSTWYKCDNFRLTFYTETAGARDAWLAAKDAAEAARDDAAYANITGSEKTELLAEIAKAEPTTAEAYGTATTALQEKTSAFTAAKDSYDGLVAMRTVGGTYTTAVWPYASATKKDALDNAIAAEPTDATDAVTKTNAIVTTYRQFVESSGVAEGVASALDYTSYIAGADPDTNTGWTGGIGTDWRTQEIYTKGDGTQGDRYYDGGWSTTAAVDINMTRELTLPAGQYLLQITARGSDKLTSYTMSIGGESVDLPCVGSGTNDGTFGHGWSDKFVVFESDGTTPLTLAIAATSTDYQQWISFNRFRLTKLNTTFATAADYANLNNAISAAEAKTLGFGDGEYAPYANVTALEKLAEANDVDQTVNNDQIVVQALTAYLNTATNWTANDGDVNAIFNGMFTESQPGDRPLAWTRSSNWGQIQSNLSGDYSTAFYNQPGSISYGNDGVYTMPLAANTAYKLTFCYRSHENGSNNGMTVSVKSGDNGISNVKFSENDSKTNWKTAEALFTTGAAGNYVLTLANSGNTWITNVSLVKSSSAAIEMTEADGAGNLQVEKYSDIKLTKTVYKGWNTVVLPFSVDAATVTTQFGAGKLYKFTDADAGQLNFEEVTTGMVAHTPYLFNSEADADAKDKELTFAGVITANGNPITQGTDYNFVGTYVPYAKNAAENPITDQDYVLGETAFKKAAGKNALKAFRCYIKANEATSTAKSLNICINGETTSIDTINGEPVNASEGIYDLSGRAVKNPTKGMYIINGKKYLVK